VNLLVNVKLLYITIFSLYITFTPICFDTCVIFRELQKLVFAKLHKFFKLKLLKLQFHKIIRLKLSDHRWVIQYSVCDITIPCESKVFMWLHIQSLVTVTCYCCRENNVIYICALVGCNKNNTKMHGTCIKIALLYSLSIVNDKIHNDWMLLKHQCVLLY
jgi:hypothetical protein